MALSNVPVGLTVEQSNFYLKIFTDYRDKFQKEINNVDEIITHIKSLVKESEHQDYLNSELIHYVDRREWVKRELDFWELRIKEHNDIYGVSNDL